jgi:cytochrome c oxidase subunit 4
VKPISQRTTFASWLVLLGLTAVSYSLSYVHLGALNIPVALLIAGIKGTLVVLIFMELGVEKFSVKMTLVVSVLFVLLLVGLMVGDVVTRATPPLLPTPRSRGISLLDRATPRDPVAPSAC